VLRLRKGLDLARFVVGFFREFVGPIGVIQSSFRMPVSRLVVALFIVLRGSAVSLGGKRVVLSGLPMQFVHRTSVQRKGATMAIYTAVPNSAPTPAVIAMASAPQNVTRIAPNVTPAPPTRAAKAPRSARKNSEVPETR